MLTLSPMPVITMVYMLTDTAFGLNHLTLVNAAAQIVVKMYSRNMQDEGSQSLLTDLVFKKEIISQISLLEVRQLSIIFYYFAKS